jgi:hypothetical protein
MASAAQAAPMMDGILMVASSVAPYKCASLVYKKVPGSDKNNVPPAA